MQTWQIVAITTAVVLVIAVVAWLINEQNRRRHLRTHFGPEYDRVVSETGDLRQAESELTRREWRVRDLDIRPLSSVDRERFNTQWLQCQALFVENPTRAVDEADRILTDVIRARGYAADNPDERLADLSAAYPQHFQEYRFADEIMGRHRRGQATTEDLRRAFIHYRALFEDILGGQDEELKRAS